MPVLAFLSAPGRPFAKLERIELNKLLLIVDFTRLSPTESTMMIHGCCKRRFLARAVGKHTLVKQLYLTLLQCFAVGCVAHAGRKCWMKSKDTHGPTNRHFHHLLHQQYYIGSTIASRTSNCLLHCYMRPLKTPRFGGTRQEVHWGLLYLCELPNWFSKLQNRMDGS